MSGKFSKSITLYTNESKNGLNCGTEDFSMIMGDSHLQVAYARGNNKHLWTLDIPRTSSLVPRTSPLALPINNPQVP